jgi:hypothetical protein
MKMPQVPRVNCFKLKKVVIGIKGLRNKNSQIILKYLRNFSYNLNLFFFGMLPTTTVKNKPERPRTDYVRSNSTTNYKHQHLAG